MDEKRKNPAKSLLRFATALAVLIPAAAALAQEHAHPQGFNYWKLLTDVADTVLFGLLGIGLLVLGYKIFDWSVPWNLNKEIEGDQNIAAAIVLAALFLGVSIIIAAVIVS